MPTPLLTSSTTTLPSSPLTSLPPPATSSANLTTSTDLISLNVSGTHFTTTIGTLTFRSHFFAALLSGRWNIPITSDKNDTEATPSLFVDSDPTLFTHILTYLRRGVFPLAFDHTRPGGHDFHFYAALLPESEYFQCDALTLWLQDELYLRCVEQTSIWKRLSDNGLGTETWESSSGVQLVKRKVVEDHRWVCPNSLKEDSHRLVYGHGLCGEPSEGVVNKAERTEWMEYSVRVQVRRGWCWDEGQEFRDYYEREYQRGLEAEKQDGITVDCIRTL